MAEGYDYENPKYDQDEDYDDSLPMTPTEPVQEDIMNHSQNIEELELKQTELLEQKKRLVDGFYAQN